MQTTICFLAGDFLLLEILSKWNHAIFGILCLVSFISPNRISVQQCSNKYQYIIILLKNPILFSGNTTFGIPIFQVTDI
jgi:hypothetical protein